MDISTKSSHQYAVNLNVIDIGENAYPAAQRGLQDLERAVARLVDQKTMQFVETHLLQLHERVRRLFSHFGAVRALAAGHLWPRRSHDATNVVYASVWELWKLEERSKRFPHCRSITNPKSAGNIVEALLGIAWICRHEPKGSFMCQSQWILEDKSEQDSAGYHGSFFQVYRSFGAIAPNLGAIASKFGAIAPNLGATAVLGSLRCFRAPATVRCFRAPVTERYFRVPGCHLRCFRAPATVRCFRAPATERCFRAPGCHLRCFMAPATLLQGGASYSAVLQGVSYSAVLQGARLPDMVLQGARLPGCHENKPRLNEFNNFN